MCSQPLDATRRRSARSAGWSCWSAPAGAVSGCGPPFPLATPTLRMGVGLAVHRSKLRQRGLRQVVGNLSLEGLVNLNEDGRPRPWLADGWATAA